MQTRIRTFRQRGFTLVELMIAVAVTGILSSVALPSFEGQLQKSRRADVLVSTMRVQAAQERFRSNGAGYGNLAEIGVPATSSAMHYALCRHTSDLDASGSVDTNLEHPANHTGVTSSLANQNFLVVGGNVACPAGHSTQVAGNNGDVYVDLSTAQHQP